MTPPALAGVALVVLLAGCSTGSPGADSADGGGLSVSVDVDTPALRTAKEQAGVEPCEPGTAQPAADGLPELELPYLGGGQPVDLSSLRGPAVVNLWAQWCGPCREELPFYQRLHEEAGDRVDVIGVDYQDTLPGKALALVAEAGVTYPLLADPAAELRVPLRVRGLPGVVFLDADGTIAHVEYVAVRSYGQLREMVAEHLGVDV